jgi:hypothetical protein
MLLYVHLHLGVQWNLSLALGSFRVTLFTPMKQCHDRMAMLSKTR